MNFRFRSSPVSSFPESAAYLAKELHIPEIAAELLGLRGITEKQQAADFLAPKLQNLPNPFLLKDMDKAVALVCKAMQYQWPVVVYGDYDVDGICATSLLVDFLKKLQLMVSWHVPNRLTDGYGLTSSGIQTVSGLVKQPALLITVDNGISANKEVKEAIAAGFHVIITDHHEPQGDLPAAHAVVNPKQQGCSFPFSGLSGVGVVFFLLMALRSRCLQNGYWCKQTAPNLKNYLDLVALGTVADVMPLTGVNRILVRAGNEVLTKRTRPGIWALCEEIGLQEGRITSEDISFRLAPRINAAGRMGSPEVAARLFLADNINISQQTATILEQQNSKRRVIEADIVKQALVQCQKQRENGATALVVYQGNWHPGVLGIVASKLCDQFDLPVIALADDHEAGVVKGSGRSAGGIDLFSAVDGCKHNLLHFGGHQQAIGLSMTSDKLDIFCRDLNARVAALSQEGGDMSRKIIVDKLLNGSEINRDFFSFLRHLEPYGKDNPEPVFLVKDIQLQHVSLIKHIHLRFALSLNGATYHGIGFGMGEKLSLARKRVDIAFVFKHSCFRGRKRIELMAVSIEPTN